MKEPTTIKHKFANNEYCPEILYKEFWGGDDYRLTCNKCGFTRIVHKSIFFEWQETNEAK